MMFVVVIKRRVLVISVWNPTMFLKTWRQTT